MNAINRIKRYFWLSVIFLSAMSLIILVIPIMTQQQNAGGLSIIIAIFFWLFAFLGYGAVFLANRDRKEFLYRRFGRDIQKNLRPGVFGFYSNAFAKFADTAAIFLLLLFVGILCTPLKNAYFAVVLLSLLIWTINMHCLFNSRTFRITKYKNKEKRGSKS